MNSEMYELIDAFIESHKSQLKKSKLPEHYWGTLFCKIKDEIFDAGNYFKICMRVNEDDEVIGYKALCSNENGLNKSDPMGVFLIDHAWTYKTQEARRNLMEHEQLLDRMCKLMNIDVFSEGDEEAETIKNKKVDLVLKNMWKYNQTYKLSTNLLNDEEREPIWYIMDEFGSSIRHNNNPTVDCSPFFYIPTGVTYTIMWPLVDLKENDEITRDYLYGIKDESLRKAKLIPFIGMYDVEEDDDDFYEEKIYNLDDNPTVQEEPGVDYFRSGRQDEILPDQDEEREESISHFLENKLKLQDINNNKINVFTDLISVKEHLDGDKYNFVDDIKMADIIFIRKHFKDYKGLYENSPRCLINQFPFENVITVKDMLAVVSRRIEDSKIWLPITYNLSYELPKFITYFKQRENNNEDNFWILKPWNLARSIDMTITNNLNQIIRSQETGPKIACKYITNPVLFHRDELGGRVKFDIRYIVLVRSLNPIIIYTYKVFWLRFANKVYSLDSFDDYEKHFTVMNYRPVNLKQINCTEFIPMFETQNPGFRWSEIQEKIFIMIRQVFMGATKFEPPKGMSDNYQSRAMYAIDLMLDWRTDENSGKKTIEPMICEINFMPDCTRACKYHPNFFNDVFDTLFLDNLDHNNVNVV